MASVKATLGGDEYAVPKMNVGQLERVAEAFDLPPARRPFAILKIALERAQPKIENFADLEIDNPELAAAVDAILSNSGFAKKASDPNVKSPAEGQETAAS